MYHCLCQFCQAESHSLVAGPIYTQGSYLCMTQHGLRLIGATSHHRLQPSGVVK